MEECLDELQDVGVRDGFAVGELLGVGSLGDDSFECPAKTTVADNEYVVFGQAPNVRERPARALLQDLDGLGPLEIA